MDINKISASDWLNAVKKKKTDWYKENGLPVPDFTKEEDFYIVNAVENDIRALVDKELAAANKRFPQFHSQHEGYAVILEEAEETKAAADDFMFDLGNMWVCIKNNDSKNTNAACRFCLEGAIKTACEAIQVAAMCKKFLEMEGRMNE